MERANVRVIEEWNQIETIPKSEIEIEFVMVAIEKKATSRR